MSRIDGMEYPTTTAEAVAESPEAFYRVYNYVSRKWYDEEYGKVELADRWYGPTVALLDRIAWELATCA